MSSLNLIFHCYGVSFFLSFFFPKCSVSYTCGNMWTFLLFSQSSVYQLDKVPSCTDILIDSVVLKCQISILFCVYPAT